MSHSGIRSPISIGFRAWHYHPCIRGSPWPRQGRDPRIWFEQEVVGTFGLEEIQNWVSTREGDPSHSYGLSKVWIVLKPPRQFKGQTFLQTFTFSLLFIQHFILFFLVLVNCNFILWILLCPMGHKETSYCTRSEIERNKDTINSVPGVEI